MIPIHNQKEAAMSVEPAGWSGLAPCRKVARASANPSLQSQANGSHMSQEERFVWVFLLAGLVFVLGYGALLMRGSPLAMP